MGATTIWERWDSMLPDGTVNPGEMTSFNHYALGRGRRLAAPHGRRPAPRPRPATAASRCAPAPAAASPTRAPTHDTPYGRAAVAWRRDGHRFELSVTVPPGAHAQVELPEAAAIPIEVGSGNHVFGCDIRPADQDPLPVEPLNVHVDTRHD